MFLCEKGGKNGSGGWGFIRVFEDFGASILKSGGFGVGFIFIWLCAFLSIEKRQKPRSRDKDNFKVYLCTKVVLSLQSRENIAAGAAGSYSNICIYCG